MRFDESVSVVRMAELIDALVEAEEIDQALHLLGHRDRAGEWERPLRQAAREALVRAALSRPDDINSHWDRRTAKIAERALAGPEGTRTTAALLDRIIELGDDRRGRIRGMPVKLTRVLVRLHPRLALDALLPALLDERRHLLRSLLTEHDDDDQPTKNAFNGVPEDVLKAWLTEDPVVRGPVLADMGSYFIRGADGAFEWTPLALALLEVATDDILETLSDRFDSGSSSGKWGSRFVRRRPMVEVVQNHPNPLVRAWAADMLVYLDKRIRERVQWDREPVDRFE